MPVLSEDELLKITRMPTMSQLIPHVFANGSRIDVLVVSCSECGGEIPHEHVHGNFTKFSKSCAISAHLLCYACRKACQFEARIRDDGTMIVKTDNGWKEDHYARDDQSLGTVLVDWFGKTAIRVIQLLGKGKGD